jgi:6-phosphogluconolactonase
MMQDVKSNVKVFNSVKGLNEFAAQMVVDIAARSVARRGRFVICLSGGNTPNGLYGLLSKHPYRDAVPWKNTFVFWSDERCVPEDDDRNNAYNASVALLTKVDLPPENIFPVPVNLTPSDAAKTYEEKLKSFLGTEDPVIDLMLLGLGDNGHTASLFPGSAVLHEKEHWVKETYVDEMHMYRVTMTPLLINKAEAILFLVTGEEKSRILEKVINCPFEPDKYPAQLIDPENGELLWLVDDKAAAASIHHHLHRP